MRKNVSRGRPTGKTDAKDRIHEAARAQFLERGYHDVSMRSIAAAAGVDAALVSYYFGSKQGVFAAALQLPTNPATIVAEELGDLDNFAQHVLTRVFAVWDNPRSGQPLAAAASLAVSDLSFRRVLSEAVTRELISPIAARLEGPDAEPRAAAFTAAVSGIIFSRHLLVVEPTASIDASQLVGQLAPALQRLITP
jgi:AcrR family transcriptional regulator